MADTVRVLDMVLDFRACMHFDTLAASTDPQGNSDGSLLEAEYKRRRSAAMPCFPGMMRACMFSNLSQELFFFIVLHECSFVYFQP